MKARSRDLGIYYVTIPYAPLVSLCPRLIRGPVAFMCQFILLNVVFHLLCTLTTDFVYLLIFVLFLYFACLIPNYIIDTLMICLFSVLGF